MVVTQSLLVLRIYDRIHLSSIEHSRTIDIVSIMKVTLAALAILQTPYCVNVGVGDGISHIKTTHFVMAEMLN